MIIREATLADLEDIIGLGLDFLQSPAYAAHIEGDPATMRATASRLIIDDLGALFVSEDRSGEVTGMIGLVLFVHPLSGLLTAGELMWFVAPEARGSDGFRLFQRGRQWAEQRGATMLQMVQPAAEPRLGPIYERLGFVPVETTWQLALQAPALAGAA